MNFITIISCLVIFAKLKSDAINQNNKNSPAFLLPGYCTEFNILNSKIRDSKISHEEALQQIRSLLPTIKLYFYANGGKDYPESGWVFPVQFYNSTSIGGVKGNGYIDSKYNYFDGNKHLGHPAHDIFITDKNQDGIDDHANKPVNVVSMTGGIVIAMDTSWSTASTLRGGKCIWIFDPYSNSIYYYAHNSKIFVQLCDILKPGDVIAAIGRTGFNASQKRSPTHLHIMQLKLDNDNYPRPFNCYKILTTVSS